MIEKLSNSEDLSNKVLVYLNKLSQNLKRSRLRKLFGLEKVNLPLTIFNDKRVLNGPFEGMLYVDFFSTGSMLYPKLLGTYEIELHPVITNILNDGYSNYIDIGCAEGYYAVGFALKSPKSLVYAFDINATALNYCKSMAKVNGVENRVILNSKCDHSFFSSFDFSKKTFILADCEGYETILFREQNVYLFKNADLLIEAHDFIDHTISIKLLKHFDKTHKIIIINSINDYQKPFIVNYKELSGLTYNQKFLLLEEKRPDLMQWIFFKSVN